MDQDDVASFLGEYGRSICRARLLCSSQKSRAYLCADEHTYPLIAMGCIGDDLFSRDCINQLHNTGEPQTVIVTKQDVVDSILFGQSYDAQMVSEMVDAFVGNRYPTVNDCEIIFNYYESGPSLSLTLKKRNCSILDEGDI